MTISLCEDELDLYLIKETIVSLQEGAAAARAKSQLRAEAQDLLARVHSEEARAAGLRIADTVLDLPDIRSAVHVFACLSFGDELDTWDLIDRLLVMGKRVFVPRSDPRDGEIHVHPYPCELDQLSFGLRQPKRSVLEIEAEAIDSTIDVALILGLGFDRRGYRLGYGRGYFDRFLLGRRFPTIGLSYHVQLYEELPRQAHDIPVSTVVTEKEIVRVGSPTEI